MTTNTDTAIGSALARIERTERQYKIAFCGAAAFEVMLLAALLMLADLRDRSHVLLLVGFVGSYSLVVLALIVLGVHINRVGLRIVRVLEERR